MELGSSAAIAPIPSAAAAAAAVPPRRASPISSTTAVATRRTPRFAGHRHPLARPLPLLTFGQRQDLASAEPNLSLAVDREHLHIDGIAFLHHIFDSLHPFVIHFR